MFVDDGLRENKIDVHTHFHPKAIFDGLEKILGGLDGPGMWHLANEKQTYLQQYGPEERLEWMSRFGIKKSVFSFPSVSLWMGGQKEKTRGTRVRRTKVSMFLNDYFAEIHQKYPARAYFYADVPLGADVDMACKELHRATEELGLSGVAIQTNISGKLPSEPEFGDFFAEAERLDVPIMMHPDNPYGMEKMMKYQTFPVIGYVADTSLAVMYMILDGFLEKHPNIKIVIGHLGGFMPYIYRRMDTHWENPYGHSSFPVDNVKKAPSEYLKHFYYDCAIGNPEALELFLKVVGIANVFFGTDHPYIESAEARTIDYVSRARLTVKERNKIYFENAEKFFKL